MANVESLRFTKTHEWLAVEGSEGTVGITQHAQEEISDVVFVELPKVGAAVRAGQEAAVVESVKAAFSIYAPVSGTVVRVNDRVTREPALLNTAPYGDGWIFVLRLQDASEVASLMTYAQYEAWIAPPPAGGPEGRSAGPPASGGLAGGGVAEEASRGGVHTEHG